MTRTFDLPAPQRKKTTALLSQLLADFSDLYSQAKQAHWNVKGANFIAIHELFDKVAGEVNDAVDELAERIMQLGGQAQGTVRVAAKNSRLKEYPLTISDSQKHIEALSAALALVIKHSRKAIDETAGLGDAVTSDMLTSITAGFDKQLWFLESHLTK